MVGFTPGGGSLIEIEVYNASSGARDLAVEVTSTAFPDEQAFLNAVQSSLYYTQDGGELIPFGS